MRSVTGVEPNTPLSAKVASLRGDVLAILVLFLLALTIRVTLAFKDIASIDRLFLPDDTYYSLAIARNLAHGHGPTADGFILTNGFQPLVTFLQSLFFRFSAGPDQAVRCAVLASALFGSLNVAALGWLVTRIAGPWVGVPAAASCALSPFFIQNDMNGLETSLSVFSLLVLFHLLLSHLGSPRSSKLVMILGLMIGISVLARVDNCLASALVTLIIAWRGGLRLATIALACAGLAVAPWWLYSWVAVGSIVPESGAAVRQLAVFHAFWPMYNGFSIRCALCVLGEIFTNVKDLGPGNLLMGFGLVLSVILSYRNVHRLPMDCQIIWAAMCLTAFGQFLFYSVYLQAIWFYPRYLDFAAILFATAAAMLLRSAYAGNRRRIGFLAAINVALASLVVFCWVSAYDVLFSTPATSVDTGLQGAKGYREVALAVLEHVPPNVTLGALQSGALSYYASPAIRVVNLDGVVNGSAYRAMKDSRLKNYILRMNITFFADWKVNLDLLRLHEGASASPLKFLPEFSAPRQGMDQTILYRVDPV